MVLAGLIGEEEFGYELKFRDEKPGILSGCMDRFSWDKGNDIKNIKVSKESAL